jgi:hypothetical protein
MAQTRAVMPSKFVPLADELLAATEPATTAH